MRIFNMAYQATFSLELHFCMHLTSLNKDLQLHICLNLGSGSGLESKLIFLNLQTFCIFILTITPNEKFISTLGGAGKHEYFNDLL